MGTKSLRRGSRSSCLSGSTLTVRFCDLFEQADRNAGPERSMPAALASLKPDARGFPVLNFTDRHRAAALLHSHNVTGIQHDRPPFELRKREVPQRPATVSV